MECYIYTTTDSNEVRQLLEKKNLISEIVYKTAGVDNYNFTSDKCRYNGRMLNLTNIPMKDGKRIQKELDLFFNPMSVISGDIDKKGKKNLMRKLITKKLFVAENNGNGVVQYFPRARRKIKS